MIRMKMWTENFISHSVTNYAVFKKRKSAICDRGYYMSIDYLIT